MARRWTAGRAIPTYWRVENGALVGEITPETVIKSNTFIIWRGGRPRDFELKLDYRITPEGNSGINYRSAVVPDTVTPANKFAMRGYQCDIDGRKRYPGNNYEEKGRLFLAVRGQVTRVVGGRPPVLVSTFGDADELAKVVTDDWNAVHLIVARQHARCTCINGQLMSVVIDDDAPNRPADGLIGVQVHVGPPMKVEYRQHPAQELVGVKSGQSGWKGELESRRHVAAVVIALLVCAGYYFGSILGLLLRVPPATPSIVWPPNAILTAALLLVPPRRWWLVLLPVLPVHVAVELPTGWPLSLVLPLFLSNCTEAIVSAGIVWKWSDAPPQFDTPRRLLIFFFAIIAGTVVSGWLDAAAVTWSVGDPFWTVWRQRLFSNILAQLVIVPGVVGVATGLPHWLRTAKSSRIVEAAIVWSGLMAMGSTELGGLLFELAPLRVISTQAPLALQLPFLLWAAVRFGTAGAGVTLFTATILSVWSVVHGQGPFAEMSPTTTVPALTLSLIVVAATVLALAALVEERRHTQSALAERLNFEELLARLSGAFVEVSSDRMDAGFDEWLGRIGRYLGVKCVRVYVLTERMRVSLPATSGCIRTMRSCRRRMRRTTFRGRSAACSDRSCSPSPVSPSCRRRPRRTVAPWSGTAIRRRSCCRSSPATALWARWRSHRPTNGRGPTSSSCGFGWSPKCLPMRWRENRPKTRFAPVRT